MVGDEALDGIDGLLVDIDGVLTISWEAIDGAVNAVDRLRSAELPVRFVTNTTSITRRQVSQRLADAGFAIAIDDVLTAPVATAAWIRTHHPDARCLLINSGDLSEDLADLAIVEAHEADLVLLGGAGPEFTYDALNAALGVLLDGAPLVAMHHNRYWRTADGFALDTGGFVAALERAAGTTATVIGKPSADFFATAVAELEASGSHVAMVGDDVESDVLAAQAAGLHGILVQTGKHRPEAVAAAAAQGLGEPERTVASFASVPTLLGIG